AATYRDPRFVAETGREAYKFYYRLRYPLDADEAGRPRRLSAVHTRLQEAGAVFGTKHGWERPDHLEPGRPWRRTGEDQHAWGWGPPPFLDHVASEHRAVRERAGLVDLSSFGKIRVEGPDALALLERVSVARIDRPVGTVVYTQWLDERAGFVADVTVTRLSAERFRVVTGAGYVAGDLGWLRLQADAAGLAAVELVDASDEWACFGLWGPRARDILGGATSADVSDGALPLRSARELEVGGARVLAQRISYAGELGWELYAPRDRAIHAWDAIAAAGRPHGLAPVGYRALDGLRMEKGYRYFGTDLTSMDSPLEAGTMGFVSRSKPDFVGHDALNRRLDAGPPATRIRTVLVGDDAAWRPAYGGEAVLVGGEPVGRLRSAAYGHTVGRMLGYVYLPADLEEGHRVEVEVLGERVPATVTADAVVDPAGDRMRG
ncbi:MAG TPA: aminomethyltransferase family protein, partial [Candidatus Limnocylindrales bacterium]|nr:aminomethyltransferase family protein [Candidatus Limnocylindrales bacterium]